MANENHEVFDGQNIATYTDVIDSNNSFTADEMKGNVLSAGILEHLKDLNLNIIDITTRSMPSEANEYNPYYFISGTLYYDISKLKFASESDWTLFPHIAYATASSGQVATSLKVKNYKNVVTTTKQTYNNYTYYNFSVTTKYGNDNDGWTNSVLHPVYLAIDTENQLMTAYHLECYSAEATGVDFNQIKGTIGDGLGTVRNPYNVLNGDNSNLVKKLLFLSTVPTHGVAPSESIVSNNDHIYSRSYSPFGWTFATRGFYNNINDVLFYVACAGLKFEYNGVMYKPVVRNGIVVGYTNDMTEESEWDDWEDIGDHDVPDEPPTPESEDAEDETFGWGGNEVGGMVRYYLLTQAEMSSLAGFMSDPSWTIDYRNCIISMFIIPNNGAPFFDHDTLESTTVKFRLNDNDKADTGVTCKRIHHVVNNTGTFEIPRMNKNFLDYEPYSKYLLYVPFCGVIPLPDYIVGKEVKVTLYPDVPTCTCTAVITSEHRKIATVRGNYGSSIPITSDGSGLKLSAILNSLTNAIVGVGEIAAGAATGSAGLVVGGAANTVSSILQTSLTLGQAFGYSVGSSGDTSFFGAGNRCEYYITYPQWDNPDGSDTNIYGHTYGYVVNKRGIIGDFEGFTVCDNPHVSGFSCTSDEKDEIERLLRTGIIIHEPSE